MFGGNIHYTPAPQKESLVKSSEFISLRNFSVEIEHMTAFDTPYKPPIAAKRISISLPSSLLAIIIKYVIFRSFSCKTGSALGDLRRNAVVGAPMRAIRNLKAYFWTLPLPRNESHDR